MTRRELYQFVQTLQAAAGSGEAVLDAVRCAMFRRRGKNAEPADAAAARLLPLLGQPDIQSLLNDDDALGQVYQALNAPALESAYRATTTAKRKFSAGEIPAVSQLFTPRWVVEYLLHNTLGKLWVQWHPETRLASQLEWLVAPSHKSQRTGKARDVRVIDPACGTMNFGIVAFDLLSRMYQEELDHAGEPGWDAPSVSHAADLPAAILRNNLFGIDIDPVALRLAKATLQMKSGVDLPDDQWNLWQADSLFDPQIAARCESAFDVVVTNPPYVSSRNLAADQVARMKKRFPAAWRDLYACFIERSLDFARDGGRVGLLAMHSFMFTGAYQRLRGRIGERSAVETLAHFGGGLFAIGNPGTLQTVALVARKEPAEQTRHSQEIAAFRLTEATHLEKEAALRQAFGSPHRLLQSALFNLPRQTWAYWIDAPLRQAFARYPRLGHISPPRQGLATTDNGRFVRYWWEIESTSPDAPIKPTPGKWFPYAKSGQFRRWYESPRHRVNWQDDGREIKQAIIDRYPYLNGQWKWVAKNTSYYGRGGITWSYLTSGRFSARRLETGAIFDVAASALFPADVPGMLAILNSSVVHRLLEAINPTVNFQVGDLAELPIPEAIPRELAHLAESAIRIQQDIDSGDEITPGFTAPPAWQDAVERAQANSHRLRQIERTIDDAVSGLYGVAAEPADRLDEPKVDLVDLARRWVSFAVGKLLGRWDGGAPGRVLQIDPPDQHLISEIRAILGEWLGDQAIAEIDLHCNIATFLAGDFFPWHVRLYHRRPPYWALRARGRLWLIAHDAATRDTLGPFVRDAGINLPRGWDDSTDDGIALRLLPLQAMITDRTLNLALRKIAEDRKLPAGHSRQDG